MYLSITQASDWPAIEETTAEEAMAQLNTNFSEHTACVVRFSRYAQTKKGLTSISVRGGYLLSLSVHVFSKQIRWKLY